MHGVTMKIDFDIFVYNVYEMNSKIFFIASILFFGGHHTLWINTFSFGTLVLFGG